MYNNKPEFLVFFGLCGHVFVVLCLECGVVSLGLAELKT